MLTCNVGGVTDCIYCEIIISSSQSQSRLFIVLINNAGVIGHVALSRMTMRTLVDDEANEKSYFGAFCDSADLPICVRGCDALTG